MQRWYILVLLVQTEKGTLIVNSDQYYEAPDDNDYDEDLLEFSRDDFESIKADQILAERKEEDLF